MARAPSDAQGKTRLLREVGGGDGTGLRRALLLDTLDSVRAVRDLDRILLFSPSTAAIEFRELVGERLRLLPQRGQNLGARMEHAFTDLFALGYSAVAIIGSDLPTLPAAHVQRGRQALVAQRDPLVLGPADDGGYYLIGLRRNHPELFRHIPWSTNQVLAATLAAADALALPVTLLPAWYDIDSVTNLHRAISSADVPPLRAARHLREWARETSAAARQSPIIA